MTRLSASHRSPRPRPSTGVRIARVLYAAIPISMAAVVLLGTFI